MSYFSGYRESHHENASSIPPLEVCVSTSPHPRVFSSSVHSVFVPPAHFLAEANDGHGWLCLCLDFVPPFKPSTLSITPPFLGSNVCISALPQTHAT